MAVLQQQCSYLLLKAFLRIAWMSNLLELVEGLHPAACALISGEAKKSLQQPDGQINPAWLLAVPPPEILEDVEDGGQYWNVLPVLLLSLGNHLELSIKGTHLFCHAQRGIR